MSLRRIQVTDFRCLQSAEIELDSEFTLVSGPNASGKTSVLEALYVLGRGRSFRTRRLEKLIRSGAEHFVIHGEADLDARRIGLGVEGSSEGMRARLGGDAVSSLAELAAVHPVQIIDPEVHGLIEEGPSRRRRFLDWGVFHVEHQFVDRWQRYNGALRQRNAALKSRQGRSIVAAWDPELIRLGNDITDSRSRYVLSLAESARTIAQRLLGLELSLQYHTGWARGVSLAEALARSWDHDQEVGTTQVGPQRAELAIRLSGEAVKDRISRGQQKLVAAALLMAQLKLIPLDDVAKPTLLLDDPAAELDDGRLLDLIGELGRQSVQLVVTSLSADFSALGTPGRRYVLDGGVIGHR
jgi:DNA replication and repair protein RecF